MKLGICTSMNPLNADKTGIESAVLYSDSGFDYLELPAAQLMALTESKQQEIVELTKTKAKPCLAFNNFFPAELKVTGDSVDKVKIHEYVDRVLSLGEDFGIENIVFGSSGARNLESDFPFAKGWGQLVELLSDIAPKAQKKGIVIVIEHLNRLESNIVTHFSEGVRLVKEVSHPNIRCLLDHYHFNLGNEDFSLIEDNFELISHVHFANVLWRTVPIPGRYEQAGENLLQFLDKKQYSHKISVEGYFADLHKEVSSTVPFIRNPNWIRR